MSNKTSRNKHDVGKVEHVYRKILHILELLVAALTIIILVASVIVEIYRIFTVEGYYYDLTNILHNVLTIVVGLEFVRMLIDMTPANTLEVLIMATARHIIMNHDDAITLLIGITCIAILFATRRFLIRRSEMTEDLVELD